MRSRLPRKYPSTSLRLVSLPLGKGGITPIIPISARKYSHLPLDIHPNL